MSKKIQTPEYWNEEWYQPLVEAETIHGNKVMIPQRFQIPWDGQKRNYQRQLKHKTIQALVAELTPGWERNDSFRRKLGNDIRKVLFEKYQE